MKRRTKVPKVLILMVACSGKTELEKILSIRLKISLFNSFHSQDNINKMKKGIYLWIMKIYVPGYLCP